MQIDEIFKQKMKRPRHGAQARRAGVYYMGGFGGRCRDFHLNFVYRRAIDLWHQFCPKEQAKGHSNQSCKRRHRSRLSD
jgi:hypothetical protein